MGLGCRVKADALQQQVALTPHTQHRTHSPLHWGPPPTLLPRFSFASERRENYEKRSKNFYLKAKAIIWP